MATDSARRARQPAGSPAAAAVPDLLQQLRALGLGSDRNTRTYAGLAAAAGRSSALGQADSVVRGGGGGGTAAHQAGPPPSSGSKGYSRDGGRDASAFFRMQGSPNLERRVRRAAMGLFWQHALDWCLLGSANCTAGLLLMQIDNGASAKDCLQTREHL